MVQVAAMVSLAMLTLSSSGSRLRLAQGDTNLLHLSKASEQARFGQESREIQSALQDALADPAMTGQGCEGSACALRTIWSSTVDRLGAGPLFYYGAALGPSWPRVSPGSDRALEPAPRLGLRFE